MVWIIIVVVVGVVGLDFMSFMILGFFWVGEICIDLVMVLMNLNKVVLEVVMVVDLRVFIGIVLIFLEVEIRVGLVGKYFIFV